MVAMKFVDPAAIHFGDRLVAQVKDIPVPATIPVILRQELAPVRIYELAIQPGVGGVRDPCQHALGPISVRLDIPGDRI